MNPEHTNTTLPISAASRSFVRRQQQWPIDDTDRALAPGSVYRREVAYATRYTEHVRR